MKTSPWFGVGAQFVYSLYWLKLEISLRILLKLSLQVGQLAFNCLQDMDRNPRGHRYLCSVVQLLRLVRLFNAYLVFKGLVFRLQVFDLGWKVLKFLLHLQAESLGALTIVLVDGLGALEIAFMRTLAVAWLSCRGRWLHRGGGVVV